MSRSKSSGSAAPTMDPGTPAAAGRAQFSIPDLLQLYRQTLYMACKEADLSAAGNPFGEDGLAAIRADLDNWNSVEFDPPGCLRLSKKSGACQKIVSYWKKLLGSILTDRDPSSFGNHDRGVMTICKLLHKDFQVAVLAITKWNDRDFPNIPTDQVKEKLSMNQLTFLCRRYHNDLTLIAHAFKSSISNNDFKYLNPRSTETYPIDNAEYETKDEESISPHNSPPKAEKRKRPFGSDEDGMGMSMVNSYESMPKPTHPLSRMSDKSFPPLNLNTHTVAFPSQNRTQYEQDGSILKSLLPKADSGRGHQEFPSGYDAERAHPKSPKLINGTTSGHLNAFSNQPVRGRNEGRDDQNPEIQRLRSKNKKYVGVIMNLVEQLVQVGQIPFVDLRCIDPEDREQSQVNIPTEQSPISSGRSEPPAPRRSSSSTTSVYINGHTQKRETQQSPAFVEQVRRKVTKPMPQVTFDRTTMRWNDAPANHNNGPTTTRSVAYPTQVTVIRTPPAANVNGIRSTLSSLLESPSGGSPTVTESKTEHHPELNGHASVKSKRKNNPVKRELPGYAPRSAASPDASGTSDDTASVASTDLSKNVRASLFVPPVETTYVDNRGMQEAAGKEGLAQPVTSFQRNENGAVNKKKCNLQSLTDSLLYANSGLTSMAGMPSALAVEDNDGQPIRITPGSVVFGKARDGCLYLGKLWKSWRAEDVFAVDEVLTPYREIRIRTEDEPHRAVFLERHRGQMCTILNLFGQQKRCHLADIFIADDKYEEYEESGQREFGNDGLETQEPAVNNQNSSSTFPPRTATRSSRTGYFRGCCFILTSQKNSLFKGYDDDQIIGLIHALGGTVAKKFEDLVANGEEKFLVAPCTCATAKFFQCLAANIPCVSYQWIIDCFNDRTKLDFAPYILPAGMDEEQVILWNPRTFMFGDQRIGLYDAASKLCETWFLALKSGNVDVHVVDPDSATKDLQSVEVLVVERSCSQPLRDAATTSGVHVVNENWLKKSLVHGKMQLWNNPEFAPDIE